MKILVVDDDKINGKVTVSRLRKRGIDTSYVDSGKAALEELNKSIFDIVLLDVIMPEMSGLEVLRKIRETQSQAELPVVMLTSLVEIKDVVNALEMGANDYLTKPIDLDLAEARIKTQMRLLKLTREAKQRAELETLSDMVATYNHEINNPLTIAMGNLPKNIEKITPEKLSKAREAMERIAQIVKKISELEEEGQIKRETYANNSSMIKL